MDMKVRWPTVTPMGLALTVAAFHDCEELDQLVKATAPGAAGCDHARAFSATRLLQWIDARRTRGSGLWCVRFRDVHQTLIGCVAAWPCTTSSVRPVAVALRDEAHRQRYTLDVVRGLSASLLTSTWDEALDPVPAAPGLIASPITLMQLATLPLSEGDAVPAWVAQGPWSRAEDPAIDLWMLYPPRDPAPPPHFPMRRRYER